MRSILLILSLVVAFQSFGQLLPPSLSCRRYTVANGLPSSETYSTYQDKKGFVWVCTDRGVCRFDGYRFKLYTINNGLVDNVVFSVYEDSRGRIWFLTLTGKLCYFENGKIVPYKYNRMITKEIKGYGNPSKYMKVKDDGTVVFSLRGRGSFEISPSGKLTNYFKHPKVYYDIERDGKKLLPHIRLYDDGNGMQTTITVREHGKTETFGHHEFAFDLRVAVYDNKIYGIDNRDLFRLENKKIVQLQDPGDGITIYSDDNSLWVGYYKGGVRRYRINKQSGKLVEIAHFFKGESISSINRDSEGSYWFSSLDNGVFYVPSLASTYLNRANGLMESNVFSINGIGDNIFVSYPSSSVQQLNAPWARFISVSRTVFTLGNFRGKLVITGFPGVESRYPYLLNVQSKLYRGQHYPALEMTSNDRQLVFVAGRLLSIDPGGKEKILYDYMTDMSDTRQESIDAIAIDNRSQVYMGNESGLYKVRNQRIIDPDFFDSLYTYRVSDLGYDPRWDIIVATRGKGVYFVRNDKVIGGITEKEGLLSNQVNTVYVDKAGRLWVSTNRGVNMIERRNGSYQLRQFSTRNGLLSNEINAVYVYGNRAWIATKAGVCIVQIDQMAKASFESKIFLNEIRTLKTKTGSPEKQYFGSGTPFIGITFRTTNFKAAPYHHFKYRLNPSSPWVMTYEPEIILNAPSSGEYKVEVTYRNEDGQWVHPKTICSFTIDSPFWTKWYFIAGMALLGIAIAFVVFRYRVKQIGKRHFYESTISQLEQKALSAQMNPHFIFNSLNSIQSFLIYEENEKAEKYLLKFSSLIRQTLSNSRERLIRIEQEMTILKDYLELEQMRFRGKFSYELKSFLSQGEMNCFLPPMLIQPYVENAIIHGVAHLKSGGYISIQFSMASETELSIVIDDNGAGRKSPVKKPNPRHRSFGTTITQERLRYFNKQSGDNFRIEITDKTENGLPSGTRITLTLPILKYYESEDGSNN